MSALAQLVLRLVDYAGLFPPAALPMRAAVREFVETCERGEIWRLDRFVLPVSSLGDFAETRRQLAAEGHDAQMSLAALVQGDSAADIAMIREFNRAHGHHGMEVTALEVRCDSPAQVADIVRLASPDLSVAVEVPLSRDLEGLIEAIAAAKVRAKVRTGGVTVDAIPTVGSLVRFMRACLDAGVAFKATAGLHHPMCGLRYLTYEASSPVAWMHGYVNVFLAAAFMQHRGMPDTDACALLQETDTTSIVLTPEIGGRASTLAWKGWVATAAEIARTRGTFAHSFGSCSIREPIDELAALRLVA